MQDSQTTQIGFMPIQQSTIHNHIHVSIRMKPLTDSEISYQRQKGGAQWQVVDECTLTNKSGREKFTFDRVFNSQITTESIFNDDLQSMIYNAMKGYNVTILAYG